MIIKEQEAQLRFNLNFEMFLSILVWLVVWGYVGYRLWKLRTPQTATVLTLSNNVPTIRTSNLEVLRSSIKASTTSNLPVVRLEPFD